MKTPSEILDASPDTFDELFRGNGKGVLLALIQSGIDEGKKQSIEEVKVLIDSAKKEIPDLERVHALMYLAYMDGIDEGKKDVIAFGQYMFENWRETEDIANPETLYNNYLQSKEQK